jgi:hypothetical protein
MTMTLMNLENWNFTRFKNGEFLTQVSIGGKLAPQNPEEVIEIYYVTTSTLEGNETFQEEFETLNDALRFINENFSSQEFENMMISADEGGCGNCSNNHST